MAELPGNGTLIGEAEIDRPSRMDWNLHPPCAAVWIVSMASRRSDRSVLQDMVRAFLGETPTFRPPPLEYLDRYLPADTEGLIGLDVRQVIAAPLVWLVGMSRRELLFLLKAVEGVVGLHRFPSASGRPLCAVGGMPPFTLLSLLALLDRTARCQR